jgi:hypothetical protein
VPIALAIAVLAAAWASQSQSYQVYRYWDSDEYFLMAQQFAAGETITAQAPYSYRVLVPWIVGNCCSADIQRGFLTVNLASGIAVALLLTIWQRRFVASAGVRLLIVTAFALQWQGPLRFAFYYPAYVDPLFQMLLMAGLLMGERLIDRPSRADGLAYTGVVMLGMLTREVMLVLPLSAVAGGLLDRRNTRAPRVWWSVVALAAGIATFLLAHAVVDPRPGYGFIDAVFRQLATKPVYSLLLVWFLAFGPMVALVAYDYRAMAAFLRGRADLAAFLVLSVVLAYIGGTDTERLIFWAMPVVYVLIAQSLERHWLLLSGTAASVLLLIGQLLSERVLWGIPSPENAVASLSEITEPLPRFYAVLNRVFVIDDFHWNLWSHFGSRPFHLVQLAFYLALSAAVVMLMRRRASTTHPTSK